MLLALSKKSLEVLQNPSAKNFKALKFLKVFLKERKFQ